MAFIGGNFNLRRSRTNRTLRSSASSRHGVAVLVAGIMLIMSAGWTVAPAAQAAGSMSSADEVVEEPTGTGTEAVVPNSPTDVTVVSGDRSLQIGWSDPEADGGNRVLEYEIVASPNDPEIPTPPIVTVAGDTFAAVLSSLVNGATYDVTVTAKIEAGSSLPALATGTPRTVPRAPAVRSVTVGDRYAVVSWTPSSNDGGAPISAYVLRAEPSGTTLKVDGAATRGRVTSLKNGVPTRLTVTPVNAAGKGAPSGASAVVTPRGVARLVVTRQPARRVLYGTPSRVRAALVTKGAVGVPGQKVKLLAKVRPSTRWRRVASGTTGTRGRVTLRTRLPASAALRLRHPARIVAAPDARVRSVAVAKRVTVTAGRTQTRLGMPVVVRGRVAPAQRVGSRVRLQRRVSGSWRRVASGHMVTKGRYVIRWDPRRHGSYVLRVVKARDARREAGTSAPWRHRVNRETAVDVARDILRNKMITLEKVHVSGGGYFGSAHQNIVDVANGGRARHSCHGGAPCGSTWIDLRVLKTVRAMGDRGSLTVSEFVGGVHSSRSVHYSGRGVDINWVNGRHVGWGTSYGMVVERCRAYGASEIWSPSNDPYGGHHNHVHCGWG